MNEISIGERNSFSKSQSNQPNQKNIIEVKNANENRNAKVNNQPNSNFYHNNDHNDVNASSVFEASYQFDGNDPNRKDVNLFISHLEVSKRDLGLDSSGFIENLNNENINTCRNSSENLNTNRTTDSKNALGDMDNIDTNKLIKESKEPQSGCGSFCNKYKIYIIIASIVILAGATVGIVFAVKE